MINYLRFQDLYKDNILVDMGNRFNRCRVDGFTNDTATIFGVNLIDEKTKRSKFLTPSEFDAMQEDAFVNKKPTLLIRYIDIPTDYYDELSKKAEESGYVKPVKLNYGTDHSIVKCPFCQGTDFINITTDTLQHQVSEADIHCANCSQFLTNWAYGYTNTHDFIAQLYTMNIIDYTDHEKD